MFGQENKGGVAVNANTIQEADSGASLIYSTQYAAWVRYLNLKMVLFGLKIKHKI